MTAKERAPRAHPNGPDTGCLTLTANFTDGLAARRAVHALQAAGVHPEAISVDPRPTAAGQRGAGQTSAGIFLGAIAGAMLGGLVAVALGADAPAVVLVPMVFGAVGLATVGAFLSTVLGPAPDRRDIALGAATVHVQSEDGAIVERILRAHQTVDLQCAQPAPR